jgi:predicted tellurium resistance membrane protein TerC
MLEEFMTLPALAGLTIVLGFNNILAIAVVTRAVVPERRRMARYTGILLALCVRMIMLFLLVWLLEAAGLYTGFRGVSLRDVLRVLGGLFLVSVSIFELRDRTRIPGEGGMQKIAALGFGRAVFRIVLLDMTLSIDSLVTVVGMASSLPLMVAAIFVEVAVILFFAGVVCQLLERFPSIETLAICALLVVGGVLLFEGVGYVVNKNFVYAMMAFALFVETVNLRVEYIAARKQGQETSSGQNSLIISNPESTKSGL